MPFLSNGEYYFHEIKIINKKWQVYTFWRINKVECCLINVTHCQQVYI